MGPSNSHILLRTLIIPPSYLDDAAFVKAKINNQGVVALGYTQALRPGVKAAFGLALDTTKLSGAVDGSPLHKVSFQYTFDT